MEKYIKPLIPISVLSDNRISSLEKLLLVHIISLCKKNGYCWATNKYFMNIYEYSKQTISKSINHLASLSYINLENHKENNNSYKRIIRISQVLNKSLNSIKENYNTSIQPKFKYNNKSNINNKYYKDDLGNEYWNGKILKKEIPTREEQQELNNLLKDFN